MPETVNYREELGIIEVHSFGEITEADLNNSRDIVARLSKEHGITKVLVDAREETSLPPQMDLFSFGVSLARADAPKVSIAAVVSPKTHDDLSFLETVAQNRGARMRVFTSVDDALAWLNSLPNQSGAAA